jgi:hypothetical protein
MTLGGLLCLVTIAWPDWLERVVGFDPDHHSGWAEWVIVVGLALLSLGSGLLARRGIRARPAISQV